LEEQQASLDRHREAAQGGHGRANEIITRVNQAEADVKVARQKQRHLRMKQAGILGAVVQAHSDASVLLRTDTALRSECTALLASVGHVTCKRPDASELHYKVERAQEAHQTFSEQLATLVEGASAVAEGDMSSYSSLKRLVTEGPQMLSEMSSAAGNVYSGLVDIGKECALRSHEWTSGSNNEADVADDDDVDVQSAAQEAGKGRQERNATGQSILKRVRLKLQGRDKDPSGKQSVAEQVQWITAQSSDRGNLAVMYEGWTAWI